MGSIPVTFLAVLCCFVLVLQGGETVRCYRCNSWDNSKCGLSVYKFTADAHFSVVECDDDCGKWVLKHDGVTDVVRGCSTDAEMDEYTCGDHLCNHGEKAFLANTGILVISWILLRIFF